MVTRRRILAALLVVVVAAAAWTIWLTVRTASDLKQAKASVEDLRAAIESGDSAKRDLAVSELQEAAASAHARTDGAWWSAMTKVPLVGDDAAGVRALSESIDLLATDAVGPLVDTVGSLDGIVSNGRIDVDKLTELQAPVASAQTALAQAHALVAERDSSGYAGSLRMQYDDYVDQLDELLTGIDSANDAIQVLPAMLGADGDRSYLFIFQNNAEIRATGGLPGSWAHIRAEDGAVELDEQGSASDFPFTRQPYVPLTDEEVDVYGEVMGQYFQDPNFTPDFPRAAQLFAGFWNEKHPGEKLDGVIALDPVAVSYLLAGTGPIQVGDLTLTSDNLVEELLSTAYATMSETEQDAFFQEVARTIFGAVTSRLTSPLDFVEGLSKAASERRFLVASFVESDTAVLQGKAILGALSSDDGSTPHVDIGLNDATAAKMSYYLRYYVDVRAQSCMDGAQRLLGHATLRQTITPTDAADLPDYVVGEYRAFGLQRGGQVVAMRIYGPFGGTIDQVRIDGKKVPIAVKTLDGRPVATLLPTIETSDDVIVTWEMETGPGQTGPGRLDVTPSVQPGTLSTGFSAAC